ncbi:MAG: ECF transporter S component [Christensenellaceae bacterium]|jgi:hypothetical protein|nr:ECF transporter S component [Christensenellaceae bacterium]
MGYLFLAGTEELLEIISRWAPYLPFIFVILGVFGGLMRGFQKSIVKAALCGTLAVVLLFVTLPICHFIIEIQFVKDIIASILPDNIPQDMVVRIGLGLIGPFVYAVLYFALKMILINIIGGIVVACLGIKGGGKHRLLAVIPGAIVGAVTAFVVLIPLNGILDFAADAITLVKTMGIIKADDEVADYLEPLYAYNDAPITAAINSVVLPQFDRLGETWGDLEDIIKTINTEFEDEEVKNAIFVQTDEGFGINGDMVAVLQNEKVRSALKNIVNAFVESNTIGDPTVQELLSIIGNENLISDIEINGKKLTDLGGTIVDGVRIDSIADKINGSKLSAVVDMAFEIVETITDSIDLENLEDLMNNPAGLLDLLGNLSNNEILGSLTLDDIDDLAGQNIKRQLDEILTDKVPDEYKEQVQDIFGSMMGSTLSEFHFEELEHSNDILQGLLDGDSSVVEGMDYENILDDLKSFLPDKTQNLIDQYLSRMEEEG